MKEYEVIIEHIDPCGGAERATKELIEVVTDDPRDYVTKNGRFPVIEFTQTGNETVIVSGDGKGYIDRYTFV